MANPVKIQADVREVVHHTDTVASYRFSPHGRVPRFRPGQFLHLALDEYRPDQPWPESRVFSIASSPSRRSEALFVTVSAKGPFTQRLVNTLEPGMSCWLKLPYGEFTFPETGHLVLIAGGVGITPYVSFLEHALETETDRPMILYYGIRSINHLLYSGLLARCRSNLTGFRMRVYCENGDADRSGPLHIEEIYRETTEDALFFLSGPPTMIEIFRQRLVDWSVQECRIRVDDWGDNKLLYEVTP